MHIFFYFQGHWSKSPLNNSSLFVTSKFCLGEKSFVSLSWKPRLKPCISFFTPPRNRYIFNLVGLSVCVCECVSVRLWTKCPINFDVVFAKYMYHQSKYSSSYTLVKLTSSVVYCFFFLDLTPDFIFCKNTVNEGIYYW